MQRAFTLRHLKSLLSPFPAWGLVPFILLLQSGDLRALRAFSGRHQYQQRKEHSGSPAGQSLGGSSTWVGMSGSSAGEGGGRRPWGGRLGRPGGRESQRWKWEHSRQAELRGERGEGREMGGRGKAWRATLSRAHTPLQRQPGIHRPSQAAVLPRLHPTPHPPRTHGSAKGPVTMGLRMQPYSGALSLASCALVGRLRPF